MPTVKETWRLRCTTEGTDKNWILDEGAAAPTTCPTDTAHTIDGASVVLLPNETVGPNDVNIVGIPHIRRDPTWGGLDTIMKGAYVEYTANDWAVVEWTLPQALHMTMARVEWEGWLGAEDYGFAAIANPGAMDTLANQASSGQADVDLGAGKEALAAYYNPAVIGKAVWVEFWRTDEVAPPNTARNMNPGLVERREVDSVSGAVITMKDNLNPKIWKDDKLRPKVKKTLMTIADDYFESLDL